MTTSATRRAGARRFALHYLEMVVVMLVGMMALAPLWNVGFGLAGQSDVYDRPGVHVSLMAVDMALAMVLWMRFRGHAWAPTVEMAASMLVPFALVLPFYGAGVLSADAAEGIGHSVMFLAMLGVMLWRYDEYAGHHAHHSGQPQVS